MATAVDYDPEMSVRAARARYFADNGFGEDGGYASKWVTILKVGPIPLGFPQTAARVRAVRRHDLHHLVTGYDTDFVGESEISAWEIASGCANFRAALILNHLALPVGLMMAPGRVRRAFATGCHDRNLYAEPFTEALLDERLGALRDRLIHASADPEPSMSPRDRLRWIRTVVGGLVTLLLALAPVLGGLAVVVLWVLSLLR